MVKPQIISIHAFTLDQALVKHSLYEKLSLLPASQFARVKNMDPKGFRKVISQLKSRCDFILIDCPAGVERGLRGVVDAADEVILVSTPDDVCIRDVEKTAGVLAQKEAPRPRLIVNRLIPELIEAICSRYFQPRKYFAAVPDSSTTPFIPS